MVLGCSRLCSYIIRVPGICRLKVTRLQNNKVTFSITPTFFDYHHRAYHQIISVKCDTIGAHRWQQRLTFRRADGFCSNLNKIANTRFRHSGSGPISLQFARVQARVRAFINAWCVYVCVCLHSVHDVLASTHGQRVNAFMQIAWIIRTSTSARVRVCWSARVYRKHTSRCVCAARYV